MSEGQEGWLPWLDWRPHFDERNMRYRMLQLDCYASGSRRDNIRWHKLVWLDQLAEGACTGFGLAHVLACSPRRHGDMTDAHGREFYYEARRWDEWAGEEYEGSSVNGAMKAGRALGRVLSWRWGYSISEIQHGLSWHGPFEIGVWWYSGMLRPDAENLIHVEGSRVGGHALALTGYKTVNEEKRLYRLENSWGPDWGDKGGCWISEADLVQLLDMDGEFAIPRKVRPRK